MAAIIQFTTQAQRRRSRLKLRLCEHIVALNLKFHLNVEAMLQEQVHLHLFQSGQDLLVVPR